MHDNVRGAHEHNTVLRLYQVVLSHGHSVLLGLAARWKRDEEEEVICSASSLKNATSQLTSQGFGILYENMVL